VFHYQVRLEVRDTPKLPIPFYKGIYLGQLTLTLGHYADGWPVRKVTHTLPPPRPTKGTQDTSLTGLSVAASTLLCTGHCALYM